MATVEEQIAALAVKTSIRKLRDPIKQKSTDWHDTAHEWLVIFPSGATTRYFTGSGHRTYRFGGGYSLEREYNKMKNSNLTEYGFQKLLGSSKATVPTLKDILYSLTSDAGAADYNFKDWCADFGYSDDSMKAMETYKACVETAGLLRGLGFKLSELQEYFQDY